MLIDIEMCLPYLEKSRAARKAWGDLCNEWRALATDEERPARSGELGPRMEDARQRYYVVASDTADVLALLVDLHLEKVAKDAQG